MPAVDAATINVVDGSCSLIQAIQSANQDSGAGDCEDGDVGLDTILLPAGHSASYDTYYDIYNGVYSALPIITSPITIQGDSADPALIERSNAATDDFRLFAVSEASLTMQAVNLRNGNADSGAAIYGYDSTITVTESSISDSFATSGAAIALQYGDLVISDSTINGNRSSNVGGAVYAYRPGMIEVNGDSSIRDNYAGTNGGAININGDSSSLNIIASTLSNNTSEGTVANEGGGAVYLYSTSLHASNTSITNNTSYSKGGAIYMNASNATFDSASIIQGNEAATGGGAFQVKDTSYLTLTDSVVQGNSAVIGNGGGICLTSSYLYVTGSRILDNSATVYGGAIYSSSSLVEITKGTTIADNDVGNGLISGNGGGVFSNSGSLKIERSTLSGNSAVSQGGGIYQTGTDLDILTSTVSGNKSSEGSGLFLVAGTTDVSHSTIFNNSATGSGDSATTIKSDDFIRIDNSVVAGGVGNNCSSEITETIVDDSVFSDPSCDGSEGRDPGLNPLLDNNAGFTYTTLTHAPTLDSPLLDSAASGSCSGEFATDQRGAPRGNVYCDIGAVEGGVLPPVEEEDDALCVVIKSANGKIITFCL